MEKCLEVEGWQAGQGVPAQGAEAVVGVRGRVACRPSACGMQLLPHPVFINYMAVEEAVHRVIRTQHPTRPCKTECRDWEVDASNRDRLHRR